MVSETLGMLNHWPLKRSLASSLNFIWTHIFFTICCLINHLPAISFYQLCTMIMTGWCFVSCGWSIWYYVRKSCPEKNLLNHKNNEQITCLKMAFIGQSLTSTPLRLFLADIRQGFPESEKILGEALITVAGLIFENIFIWNNSFPS